MSVSSISVFDRLDADWSITRRTRAARIALHRWKTLGEHADVFAPFDSLGDILDALHATTTPDASDRLLGPLLHHAHRGDELAARVVLQAFVPLAASLTSGRKLTVAGIDYQFEVVTTLSEMIAEFPLDTHHTHLAGHLAFMVRRKLERARRRKIHPTTPFTELTPEGANYGIEEGLSIVDADEADPRTCADRVAQIVTAAVATGSVTADQGQIVLLVAAGHRVATLARHAGCHRSAMGRRLTHATTLLAAVAA